MRTTMLRIVAFALVLALGNAGLSWADSMGSAFTYQGQLKDDGKPVNDTCDFEFGLWDTSSGGSLLGTNGVTEVVTDGLFTVTLDFGEEVFNGQARWLEIAVKGSADPGFTTLSPRQELTPAPYALNADKLDGYDAGNASGEIPISNGTKCTDLHAERVGGIFVGQFNCGNNNNVLVNCVDVELQQRGSRNLFRIHSAAADWSGCYAYYHDGVLVSKAFLAPGGNYDFNISHDGQLHHDEVILARPWAGGSTARVDIFYENTRCGGTWYSPESPSK